MSAMGFHARPGMEDLGPVLQHLWTLVALLTQAHPIDLTAGAGDDLTMECEAESDAISDREVARALRSRPGAPRKKVMRRISKKTRVEDAVERGWESL